MVGANKLSTNFRLFIFTFTLLFFLGIIPNANALDLNNPLSNEIKLIPMGYTVGIKLSADGVIVVGLSEVGSDKKTPAADAGLRTGDVITHLGAVKIADVDTFKKTIASLDDSSVTVRVMRNGKQLQFLLKPSLNSDGTAELGLWLRDGIAGIGTMTFLDPLSGIFGALGHSVSDADSGIIIPMKNGSIMKSTVTSVIKGKPGSPGQLQGDFELSDSGGSLFANTPQGIFGFLSADACNTLNPLPIAHRPDIHAGSATILSNIEGNTVAEYEIEISRIYPDGINGTRDMMIRVTDSVLLEKTGGIVQGMSGSPILQDGKFVGAVTHVLVNDPTKGYAIMIDNMLNEALANKQALHTLAFVVFPRLF